VKTRPLQILGAYVLVSSLLLVLLYVQPAAVRPPVARPVPEAAFRAVPERDLIGVFDPDFWRRWNGHMIEPEFKPRVRQVGECREELAISSAGGGASKGTGIITR
jgi:hypothetical protein